MIWNRIFDRIWEIDDRVLDATERASSQLSFYAGISPYLLSAGFLMFVPTFALVASILMGKLDILIAFSAGIICIVFFPYILTAKVLHQKWRNGDRIPQLKHHPTLMMGRIFSLFGFFVMAIACLLGVIVNGVFVPLGAIMLGAQATGFYLLSATPPDPDKRHEWTPEPEPDLA